MEVIKLEPADVLVHSVPDRLSQDQITKLTAAMAQQFGPNQKVLVMHAGASMSVVRQQSRAVELAVKFDTSAAFDAVRAALAPGAMLLPPEAVDMLLTRYGIGSAQLESIGGVPAKDPTQDDDAVGAAQLDPYVWLAADQVMADQIPYGTHTDGRIAIRVDDLTEAQRMWPEVRDQLAKIG